LHEKIAVPSLKASTTDVLIVVLAAGGLLRNCVFFRR
jgi:hypothetical protein